jgi:hypothetical protein
MLRFWEEASYSYAILHFMSSCRSQSKRDQTLYNLENSAGCYALGLDGTPTAPRVRVSMSNLQGLVPAMLAAVL